MPRRDSLAPVELVEADEPPAQEEPAVRRRRRWWLWAVPLAAVAIILGVQLVADARARAADARIAALPGAIDPLGDSLDARWHASNAFRGGTVSHDALHAVVTGPDGALTYDALDLGTGDVAWSAPLAGPDAALMDARTWTRTTCQPWADPGVDPDRAVCLVTDGHWRYSADGADESDPPTRSRVVVLDLADGRVLAEHPGPLAASMAVLPGLMATADVDDQRHVVVVATDPLTGEELWRYRDSDPVQGVVDSASSSIVALGGMVVLLDGSGDPMMVSASGQHVEADRRLVNWGSTRDGWLVWERPNPDGGPAIQQVTRPDAPPLEVLGRLLERTVDDDSVPGLEVSSAAQTYGWDARTGEQLWAADVAASGSGWSDGVLVLDEIVYLTSVDDVVALDARTGQTRWTAPRLAGAYWGELLTDGANILLVETPEDQIGTVHVTVLDRRDGTLVRRLALPDGVTSAQATGRHLIGITEQGLVGLG